MIDNQTFTKQELDSALGRLQWATNCCPLTKPFHQQLSPPEDLTSCVDSPTYSAASLRKTTIIQPRMPLKALGGGRVMQVPQIVEKRLWGVGSATNLTQRRIRFCGFITKLRRPTPLGFQGSQAQASNCCPRDAGYTLSHDVPLQEELVPQGTGAVAPG